MINSNDFKYLLSAKNILWKGTKQDMLYHYMLL